MNICVEKVDRSEFKWIDVDCSEDLEMEIEGMGDVYIVDMDGPGPLTIQTIPTMIKVLDAYNELGHNDAFLVWLANDSYLISLSVADMVEFFENDYQGTFENGIKGYVEEVILPHTPGMSGPFMWGEVRDYIDVDRIANDLDCNGMWEGQVRVGEVAVFSPG